MLFRRLALLLTLASLSLCALPASGAAAVNCDRVASPTGSDIAAGTVTAPYRTAQKLADSLASGQTGCFRAGLYAANDIIRVARAGITLTSYPGERATLKGRLYIVRGANGVSIIDLDLDGRNSQSAPGIAVNAADTLFRGLDVTNYNDEICFVLGNADYGRAVRTIIEQSRIHNCGLMPPTNQDHGIYVDNADGTIIRDNWIYDNADRGVQVYPDAQGTQVYRNVIDGNGEGIVISGDGQTASSDTDVHHNVISNSKVRWNLESAWPNGLVGRNNRVHDNCVFASNARAYYNLNGGILPASEGTQGFVESGNVIARPGFADEAANNFTLTAASPCAFVYAEPAPLPVDPPVEEEPVPPPPAEDPVVTEPVPPAEEPVVTEPAPVPPSEPIVTEPEPGPSTDPAPAPAPVEEPATSAPAPEQTVTDPALSDSTVIIRPRRRGRRTSKVAITGRVKGPGARASADRYAKVFVKRNGAWRRVAVARLRADGSFAVRRLIRPSRGARLVRVRAAVRGVGFSRTVSVRVARRR